ncbi:unnamed protein product [Spodoptera littoralis]|uniref:Uncharacterized protein n=1 Tax=Spodoptera littoralis TaxID=7109 RepID=A0A9P0I5K3_SPOLI|nr:unnamed protein product [Spodoptera littoralis]CAH1640637.1 unnamed protein product [Spodoptera littoralis]
MKFVFRVVGFSEVGNLCLYFYLRGENHRMTASA